MPLPQSLLVIVDSDSLVGKERKKKMPIFLHSSLGLVEVSRNS